ncbi:MAG TPA: thioesterase family protein [Candidatus Limnocylindrales bacterium]|nr:thioesterase family protein [Candidatus Limnocylindrales bacterium]
MPRRVPASPAEPAPSPDGAFRYSHPVEVRFRDTDALGHVNNAVYLSYFEIARAGYYAALTGRTFEVTDDAPVGIILAHARLEFRAPAYFGETLHVACRAGWVGRSSFSLDYRITASDDSPRGGGRLVADGETVQVVFDYGTQRATRMPDDLRAALEAYEGRPLPARRPPA